MAKTGRAKQKTAQNAELSKFRIRARSFLCCAAICEVCKLPIAMVLTHNERPTKKEAEELELLLTAMANTTFGKKPWRTVKTQTDHYPYAHWHAKLEKENGTSTKAR